MTKTYRSMAETAARIVAHLRRGKNVDPQTVVGPVVWGLNGDKRRWYYVIGTADARGPRFDALAAQSQKDCTELHEPRCSLRGRSGARHARGAARGSAPPIPYAARRGSLICVDL